MRFCWKKSIIVIFQILLTFVVIHQHSYSQPVDLKNLFRQIQCYDQACVKDFAFVLENIVQIEKRKIKTCGEFFKAIRADTDAKRIQAMHHLQNIRDILSSEYGWSFISSSKLAEKFSEESYDSLLAYIQVILETWEEFTIQYCFYFPNFDWPPAKGIDKGYFE